MKSIGIKSGMRQILLLLLITIISLHAISQNYLGRQNILQFDPQNSVLQPDAPLLKESLPMEKAKNNALFLSGVGGVSFDQVAQPNGNFKNSQISLNYNKNNKDGSRLELLIDNKKVMVYLPDWMLIPITKYAESPYYSCVTIFGKLKDKTLENAVKEHKGRIINYHPAYNNTLMGNRLSYMDMLIGYNFTNDLPKNDKGKYILGTGESIPNVKANNKGAYNLSQHFTRVQNKYMETFRSYVISDFSQKITFNIMNDSLNISGTPYYYCWKSNSDRNDYDINKVAGDISAKYQVKIKEIAESSGGSAVQNWYIDRLITLSKKYEGNYSFYTKGTFIDLVKLKTDIEKRKLLERYAPESLFKIIVETETYMDRDSVLYLKEFSDDVSSKPELFNDANPEVWNATVNTMRYAAFFRFVKTNFPETWLALQNQIKALDPEPRVTTPTIMYNPDSKEIEKAIMNSKKK